MSQNYQQYSGNPYGQAEAGYGQLNPYGGGGVGSGAGGGGYGSSNPYGGGYDEPSSAPVSAQRPTQYAAPTPAAAGVTNAPVEQHGTKPLSQQDFLSRIDGTKQRIGQLTSDIQSIASVHQRMLSSPDTRSSSELESIVSQTQLRNTQIKDEIKFLEKDAAREPNNSFKRTQVDSLKRTFRSQLEDFQREEADYSKRYREAIGRQYRIINPDATEGEVREAMSADWGDEGIFTQALKSNRSGQASSVLGAVRARHNDIQRIEKTMSELALLFQQLNEQVVYQEAQVEQVENQTVQVNDDAKHANTQLDQGIKSARRARKLKWWVLLVVVIILIIVAVVLAWWFTTGNKKSSK